MEIAHFGSHSARAQWNTQTRRENVESAQTKDISMSLEPTSSEVPHDGWGKCLRPSLLPLEFGWCK